MLSKSKRQTLTNPTVGELITALQQLPKEASLYTCGETKLFLHVDTDGSVIIDNDNLESEYEYIDKQLAEESFTGNVNNYVTCSTYGDYSPSNPWNAPGMSAADFI